jgi:hypothetical protein
MNKRNKIIAAALAAGTIGVGVTTAHAAPPTAPPSAAYPPSPTSDAKIPLVAGSWSQPTWSRVTW